MDNIEKRAIRRISVKGLFGIYDYDLTVSSNTSQADKIFILYGDNGSGKTTLLKLAFHLLAPDVGRGHKTAIAHTEFVHFEIELLDKTRVWALRPNNKPIGSFSMGFKIPKHKEQTIEFIADADNTIRTKDGADVTSLFLAELGKLNISLYFLSDNRTIQLAGLGPVNQPPYNVDTGDDVQRILKQRRMTNNEPEELAQQLLAESINRAEYWIRRKAIQDSSTGESNVNALYNQILQRLVSLKHDESIDSATTKKSIEERILKLEQQCGDYSQYGLMPKFSGSEMLKAVSSPNSNIGIITNVLNPYLESLERKLEALNELYIRLNSFVTIINTFFSNKTLSFSLRDGLIIRTESKPLSSAMLSSGERHLMLLFCSSLVAADKSSILIIDEPEISLNIKWQRSLLSSLLKCIADSHVQYVFATHSLEILSQHKDRVCKLENKAVREK